MIVGFGYFYFVFCYVFSRMYCIGCCIIGKCIVHFVCNGEGFGFVVFVVWLSEWLVLYVYLFDFYCGGDVFCDFVHEFGDCSFVDQFWCVFCIFCGECVSDVNFFVVG